jgi:hypothetical protein
MLTEPLIEQLNTLRLRGMAAALKQQLGSADGRQLSFEDRLGRMIQQETVERANARFAQRPRWAKLPISACLEDLDTRTPRGIDKSQFQPLTEVGWIRERLNVLVTGPTGVGKSFIASALGDMPPVGPTSPCVAFACPGLSKNLPTMPRCRNAQHCCDRSPKLTCSSSMTSASRRSPMRPFEIFWKSLMTDTITAPP